MSKPLRTSNNRPLAAPREPRKARLHPTVAATGWASFLNDFSSEMIYPLLPIFLTNVLGVGTAFVGLIEGVAESTASLLKLFSGWLSDRLQKRKALVLLGYALAASTRPLIALSAAGWHVLELRFIDRMGKGLRGPPRDALVADVTPPSERGMAFGYQRAMDHAGAIAGPLTAAALLSTIVTSYRSLFALAGVPALFCVATVWRFVKEPPATASRKVPCTAQAPPLPPWRSVQGRLKSLLLAVGLFALGNSTDAFLILRAQNLGISLELIPILWVVLHISKSVLSIPAGMLSDRIGRLPTIVTGWMVYGLVYLGFAFSWTPWHAWALFGSYGIYFALTEGVERAYVADVVSRENRGTAFGSYNFVVGVSALPASLIFGVVWSEVGFRAAFVLGATLALLAAVLLVTLDRRFATSHS